MKIEVLSTKMELLIDDNRITIKELQGEGLKIYDSAIPHLTDPKVTAKIKDSCKGCDTVNEALEVLRAVL